MMHRRWLLELSVLTVSCMVVLVPSASAKSGREHLLPLKACNEVMTSADFDDGLEQVAFTRKASGPGETDEASSCLYASLEANGPGPHHVYPEPPEHFVPNPAEPTPSLALECFANIFILGSKLPPVLLPPEAGGCYSKVSTEVSIGVGPKLEAQLRHAGGSPRNYRDRGHWPVASRTVLHTFGAYADAELGDTDAPSGEQTVFGYLHIKNAQITIEESTAPPDVPRSMLTLLEDAKSTL